MSINIRSICEDDFEDMAELLTCQKEQEWVFLTAKGEYLSFVHMKMEI